MDEAAYVETEIAPLLKENEKPSARLRFEHENSIAKRATAWLVSLVSASARFRLIAFLLYRFAYCSGALVAVQLRQRFGMALAFGRS